MRKGLMQVFAAAAFVVAAPVSAQSYSDSYTFMKAVKERDGTKVTDLISQPGSIVINTRERGSGDGAVHILARSRDLTWLTFLLGKGARPDLQNNEGTTALILAAQLGWVEGAEALLNKRASVDLANGRGETPLILAVQRRDLPMVRLLLARGADPKRADRGAGMSAIDHATRDGARSAAILKMLQAPRAASAPAKKPAGPKL